MEKRAAIRCALFEDGLVGFSVTRPDVMHHCGTVFAWRREKVAQAFAHPDVIKNVFLSQSFLFGMFFSVMQNLAGWLPTAIELAEGNALCHGNCHQGPFGAKSFWVTLSHCFVCAGCDFAGNIAAFIGKLESCEATSLAEVEAVSSRVFPWTVVSG